METVIYLARHGMTEWQEKGLNRLAGRLRGIRLSPEGKRQAEELARALRAVPLDRVISSPLERTMETAGIIARLHALPVEVDERLTEWGFGIWEGMHIAEIARTFPHEYQLWREEPDALRIPGGESAEEVASRMYACFTEAAQGDGTFLLVSHQDPLLALLCRLLGLPLRAMRSLDIDLGSLSKVRVHRGRAVVEFVNCRKF
ncbi:MAG: histidine phosphatase family protein [Armatimonadota bacterium]|nr:histidine phosphatase family protein [Armatimonadota bacterium]MDR5702793.1 histidine phosphatase family protein [Armatimonadota bacterium]